MKETLKPDFHLPTEIFIRENIIESVGSVMSRYGTRAIIITTSHDFEIYHAFIEQIAGNLKQADIGCIIYDELPQVPTTEDIDSAVSFVRKTNTDLLIGFGGIESVNAAKAISVLSKNYIFCHDLLAGAPVVNPPLPVVTMPAFPLYGLGLAPLLFIEEIHELTKRAYSSEILYPKAVVVDPALSLNISDEKYMKMCICAMGIAAESVISRENNDIINTYSLKTIDLSFRNLPLVMRERENIIPRKFLSTASVMSGIAFATAYLSVTLGISLSINSITGIDIESAMCVILPHIMEFNLTSSPGKYVQMAKVMGENVRDITVIEAAIKGIEGIRKLETDIDIPQRLSNYNISKTMFKQIAELSMSYPFLANSFRELNAEEIETILIAAF